MRRRVEYSAAALETDSLDVDDNAAARWRAHDRHCSSHDTQDVAEDDRLDGRRRLLRRRRKRLKIVRDKRRAFGCRRLFDANSSSRGCEFAANRLKLFAFFVDHRVASNARARGKNRFASNVGRLQNLAKNKHFKREYSSIREFSCFRVLRFRTVFCRSQTFTFELLRLSPPPPLTLHISG